MAVLVVGVILVKSAGWGGGVPTAGDSDGASVPGGGVSGGAGEVGGGDTVGGGEGRPSTASDWQHMTRTPIIISKQWWWRRRQVEWNDTGCGEGRGAS